MKQDGEERDIYFHRETLVESLEDRDMDMITVSSTTAMLSEKEPKFNKLLFPKKTQPRPYKFDPIQKQYVMITARVHPGETPGSHVFNGLLKFILDKNDIRSRLLRDNFVFVLIPMLNPDGVYRGHYRLDT